MCIFAMDSGGEVWLKNIHEIMPKCASISLMVLIIISLYKGKGQDANNKKYNDPICADYITDAKCLSM